MALLWRVRVGWTGGRIGNGFSNFFFTADVGTAQQANDAVRAFFATAYGAAGTGLPTGVTLTFPTQIDILEPGTGILLDAVPVSTTGPITGIDGGVYAAPAGMCVTWRTTGIVNGQRVRGRTFLVPLGQSMMQADGTPSTTSVNNASSAAAALIAAAPELVVWHRPISVTAGGGEAHPVISANVRDTVAMLTSRR